ncbi:MAG TPA: hypothetical protein VKV69_05755, partial [Actinomycetota bacterium]|nr:hypothetical protein [Actinomycetota bacterium]
YDAVERAEQAALAGDMETAAREYEVAEANIGDNVEASFWAATSLAAAGNEEEARAMLQKSLSRHDGWAELLRRLPAAGLFPDDPALIERLLARD